MSGKSNKRLFWLAITVLISFLCLLQTSCRNPNNRLNRGDRKESSRIDPDKFKLELKEDKRGKSSNLVLVIVTPGSGGMELKDFFITAAVEGNSGTVKGTTGRKAGNGFNYDKDLNNQSLEELFVISSDCSGSQDNAFKQGKKGTFKLKYEPGPGTQQGDKYTLTVKIERKGSNPHTEETSRELIAPATKQLGQSDRSTTAPPIAPDKFGLTLKEDKRGKSSNLVLVTVTPGSRDMELKDFFITAAVEGNSGTVKGTTGRKAGTSYNYDKDPNDLSLEELFVNSSRCLGSKDTTFKQKKEFTFRLRYEPGPGTQQGDKYTLTVKIEHKGSSPHTEETSKELTAPQNLGKSK